MKNNDYTYKRLCKYWDVLPQETRDLLLLTGFEKKGAKVSKKYKPFVHSQPKNHIVIVRLTRNERENLNKAAKAKKMKISTYVRSKCCNPPRI